MFSDEPSTGLSLFTNNTAQSEEMSRLIKNKHQHSAMFGSDQRRAFPQPPSNKSTPQKSSVVQPVSTQPESLPVPIIQPSVDVNNVAQENIQQVHNQPEKIEIASKEESLQRKTVRSKPGGYSYEMNKLLFMSSFIELLKDHNIVAPEEVFEDTDITPKLFEFFKQYGICPSEKAIPRFQVTKSPVISEDFDRANIK